jgi:hypothetical protein
MTSSLRGRLALGLVAGALLRAVLLPHPGTPDVPTWKAWAFAGSQDVTAMYGVGGSPPERGVVRWQDIEGTTEYPPLALYELAAVGHAYRAIDPDFEDGAVLTALVKLPGLLAEIALVVVVLVWGRRALGDAGAVWMALAVWLNPAVLVNGAALGYLDAQMAVPAALAMLAAARGWPGLAGALAAAAVLTKAQAVFVGPALLLALWRQPIVPTSRAVGRFLAGGLAAALLVVLPIILRGAWPNMVQAIGRLAAHDMLSGYGLNAWWIVTWFVRSSYGVAELGWFDAFTLPVRILGIERFMEVGFPNPKPIGAVVVLAAIGWGLWRARRARTLGAWAALGGWSVLTYFLFSAQVHENHLYLAVPMLALAAAAEPRWRALFWAVSVATALNMYLFYGLGAPGTLLIDRGWTLIDLSVLAAAANIAIWGTGLFSTDPARAVPGLGAAPRRDLAPKEPDLWKTDPSL